jgi:hypothetical protein
LTSLRAQIAKVRRAYSNANVTVLNLEPAAITIEEVQPLELHELTFVAGGGAIVTMG